MTNGYMSARDAAAIWGISKRHVLEYCTAGRIEGAMRLGNMWILPRGMSKPDDLRHTKKGIEAFSRNNPLIIMTDLYTVVGRADAVAASLKGDEAVLFKAQLAYFRGDINSAYEGIQGLLKQSHGFNTQVGTGMLLSLCAMYRGNMALWKQAKEYISSAPCESNADKERLSFWLAAADSSIYDKADFPSAFCRGSFNFLPSDCFESARFYYAKYLFVSFLDSLEPSQRNSPDNRDFNLMWHLPSVCEALLSHSRLEGNVLAQIYLGLICAIAYHNRGDNALAAEHIDNACALAIPDELYSPLAEYRRPLDFLLDERLGAINTAALSRVKALNKQLLEGWVTLHNTLLERSVSNQLTTREREAARLASYGLSNNEIAQRLHISIYTVKQALRLTMEKTGAKNRSQLAKYI